MKAAQEASSSAAGVKQQEQPKKVINLDRNEQ